MKASNSILSSIPLLQRRVVVTLLQGMVIGGLIAAGSLALRKPRYLANLVLSVGKVGYVTNAGLVQVAVERPQALVERLRYEHGLKGIGKKMRPLPYLYRARLSRSDNNLVVLEAHGRSEEQTTEFLTKLSAKLISDHATHFEDAGGLWQQRHDQLRKHLRIIDGVIDKQLDALAKTPKGNDQIHAVRLMQMGILTSHREKADEDLHLLNISRSRFYTVETRILQKPENTIAVGLSKPATVVTGSVAGALIGCLLGLLTLRRDDD
jgi:hypothetical protein